MPLPHATVPPVRLYPVLLGVLLLVAAVVTAPLGSTPAGAAVGCYGAAAMAAPTVCPPTTHAPTVPDPTVAAGDRSDAWRTFNGTDCFAHTPTFPMTVCQRGADPKTAVGHIAVIGNSHAGQWLSAIEQVAVKRNWTVTTYLASGCAAADIDQTWPDAATTKACRTWAQRAAWYGAHGGYGLVIFTNKVWSTALGFDLPHSWAQYQLGYQRVLYQMKVYKKKVLAIRDTPAPGFSIPACLSRYPTNFAPCTGAMSKWLPPEPVTAAVAALKDPQMAVSDLTKYFCSGTACPGAIGSVPVYFDGSHLTSTYAATVAPFLEPWVMHVVYS